MVDLFRVTKIEHSSPWYFASEGHGRFDLSPPRGTCYAASDAVGALREAIGPDYEQGAIIATDFFEGRSMWRLSPIRRGWDRALADLLSDGWDSRGLTLELFTTSDYANCQAWARCFDVAEWAGLRARLKHVMGENRWGAALFGDGGACEEDARFTAVRETIASALVSEFRSATGIAVEPTPAVLSELDVIS